MPAPTPQFTFPTDFLWGAASSPHQTEGNNVNSDWWRFENAAGTILPERSGTAVDSYNRYPEDMRLLAASGLTSYRFGLEWARIEPSAGEVDERELQHYRRMIEVAHELGITPVVTLNHFSLPAWFNQAGGWSFSQAPDRFAQYVQTVIPILHDVPWVCTINEPNMIAAMSGTLSAVDAPASADKSDDRAITALVLPTPDERVSRNLEAAHRRAVKLLHAQTNAKVGWTVANQAFQATPGNEEITRSVQWAWEGRFLDVARDDDFIGVQSYTTKSVDENGPVPHPPHPDNTLTGWPNRPEALGLAVRYTWEVTDGTPIIVTENGIPTADDDDRIEYTHRALLALQDAAVEGIDVRGYLHWSLLDNYEWGEWGPTFGLIAVDRTTYLRSPKPSLEWLGNIARAHRAKIVSV